MSNHSQAEVREILNRYLEHYKTNAKAFGPEAKSDQLRREALAVLEEKSLPRGTDEAYRHAKVPAQFAEQWEIPVKPRRIKWTSACVFQCDIPKLDAYTCFFVDGFFYGESGDPLVELPNGVVFGSLAKALDTHADIVWKYLGKRKGTLPDGVAALSQLLAQDGMFVYVPQGVTLDRPIQVISVTEAYVRTLTSMHHLVVAEEQSKVQVLLCENSVSPAEFLRNDTLEIHVLDGANLELEIMQNAHNDERIFQHLFANLHADATFLCNNISLHGGFLRNNTYVELLGQGADAQVNGLALVDKTQYLDAHTIVEHHKPNCRSSQLFKHLVDDQGEVAFRGVINVHPDAQQTEAYQRNANLLLTDQAKAHTQPQLIIHADDVKCSHGATIGQLDEEARFYLQSRGIPPKEVNRLLMYAFVGDILQTIGIPSLRQRVDELVEKRIRGGHDVCHAGLQDCD